MKHSDPFGDALRIARNPGWYPSDAIAAGHRARLDDVRRRARAMGLPQIKIADLVMRGPEEAERRLVAMQGPMRLRDLARSERLRATCTGAKCRHVDWVDLDRRRWGHLTLLEITGRLRCRQCGAGHPRLEVGPGWPRD